MPVHLLFVNTTTQRVDCRQNIAALSTGYNCIISLLNIETTSQQHTLVD